MAATTTPISTFKVFLMKKATDTYAKLVDIKDFPDLGGAPEALETTTMSDPAQTYIPGLQSQDALTFTANYIKGDYDTLAALKGTEGEFAIWFGGTEANGVVTPTGDDGKYEFKGYLTVNITGAGVNEVINMTITIMPTTPITPAAA